MFRAESAQVAFADGEADPEIFDSNVNTVKISISIGNLIKWISKRIKEQDAVQKLVSDVTSFFKIKDDATEAVNEKKAKVRPIMRKSVTMTMVKALPLSFARARRRQWGCFMVGSLSS